MNLATRLEAILFTAARPLTKKKLVELTRASVSEIEEAASLLADRLTQAESAIQLTEQGSEMELTTRGEVAEDVRAMVQDETTGELTRPSLEALSVLAYRGPMTRPELEQIRGIQSSLILRNLLLRGLVEVQEDARLGQPLYAVTIDFLKTLGVARLQDLPDYVALHAHPVVEKVLAELEPRAKSSTSADTTIII